MAQNRFNLSPEDQQMFEEYFKQKEQPSMVDNAFDITPDKLNPLAQSIASGGQDLLNLFQSQNLKTGDESFNFASPMSKQQEVVSQDQQNIPFYQLPFEKPSSPVSQESASQQMTLKMPMPKRQIPSVQAMPEAGPQTPSAMQQLLSQYKNLYSTDQIKSDADQMNQALDKKRELALLDMFMKGGSQLAAGIAQTKPTETIQTAGLADIDIEKAKQKAGLTDRQRQALEAQMKILDVEEMNDPNSPTSKVYRQTLSELSPSIAQMPDLKNASAQAIGKIFPMVQAKIQNDARIANQQMMLQFKTGAMGQREKEEQRRTQQAHLNAARGLLKDDPRFKKAIEQGMEFESVNSLLDEVQKGNETALSALGTKLARAMGEVGVLTDTHVVRYIAGQSWGRQLEKWYKGGMQGKMPASSLKEIRKNLTLLRGKLSGDVDKVYGNAGNRLKSAFPELDDKSIKGLLGQPMIAPEEKQEVPSINDFEDIE